MRRCHLPIVLALFFVVQAKSQQPTANEVLEKSIAYHDPNEVWQSFEGTFSVLMESPNTSNRLSTLTLNHPQDLFKLDVEKDDVKYSYILEGSKCVTLLNGSPAISDPERKKYRITCERGQMLRDYYTYLYGLPMKLRDAGTILHPDVQTKSFKGKEYLVIKVSYNAEVGEDTWYFYFDPETYAMEVYQFYHDESKNDGEYILLAGIEEIQGIKMPKERSWYMNKDHKFLGKDILKK